MCATEEQLAMIATAGIDHVSYLLGIYSLAFILYLCKFSVAPDYIPYALIYSP